MAWWSRGLEFRCTACGACCRRAGVVVVGGDEADAIARFLRGPGASADGLVGPIWSARGRDRTFEIDVPEGGACTLLDAQGRCRVHPVKPAQCATYPFWPENLGSRRRWRSEAVGCEGIGDPSAVWDAAAIAAELRRAGEVPE